MAVLLPVMVAVLAWELLRYRPAPERLFAGVVAGLTLLFTGVYVRSGLALMSDLPALFWTMLGLNCWVRAVALSDNPYPRRAAPVAVYGFIAGLALGMAVAVRYTSVLLVVPALAYLLAYRPLPASVDPRAAGEHPVQSRTRFARPTWALQSLRRLLTWGGVGFAMGLLPQIAYRLSYTNSPAGLPVDWNMGNFFATIVSRSSGDMAVFSYPMSVFYVVMPAADPSGTFLSPLYLPALALGLALMVRKRQWPALTLLVSWWLVPALFLSGTTFQTHRYVLAYLPPLAVLIGTGTINALRSAASTYSLPLAWGRKWAAAVFAALALVGIVGGLSHGLVAAHDNARMLAGFQAEEQALASLVKEAVSLPHAPTGQGSVGIVCFGVSAALYHNTGWAVLDFYNHDEAEINHFVQAHDTSLLVVPTELMDTRWHNTPSARRWHYMQRAYRLVFAGRIGQYSVYLVEGMR
jgi:4-amino-4-deoxy-L-arabinose transferase-like glycosyltransferase